MQSLIHGNFEGAAQKQAYALVGAAAAIAAAVGPLLGGFVTTYLSWRVGFLLEDVVIVIVLVRHPARPRCAVHGPPADRSRLAPCSPSSGWAGSCSGILVWQEGGESVALLIVIGAVALAGAGVVARAAQARGQGDADRSGPVPVEAVPVRDHRADAPADRARRHDDRAPDLPADGARVQRACRRACRSRRCR